MKNVPPPVQRNREVTEQKLIRAVGSILMRDGHAGLGVNAVAREACVDKVLIYRYFGGLTQLVERFGRTADFWPSEEELVGGDLARLQALPPKARYAEFVRSYVRAIRSRPLLREVLVWDAVEKSELTAVLDDIRESTAVNVISALADGVTDSPDDFFAVLAVLGAATHYFTIIARNTPVFAGVDLQSEEGWNRLETAMMRIVELFLSDE